MKRLQTTLFVIAFVVLSTQTFRHVYVKWIEPRASVMDAYREPVDTAIAEVGSLDELAAMYQRAHAQVEEYESKPGNAEVPPFERSETEPYATMIKLADEIRDWEARRKNLFELRFFWSLGLVSVMLGLWGYHKQNAWLGMAAIIAGFAEMAYWTSPLNRHFGAVPEFERLLSHKFVFSLISWGLLVTLWLLADKFGKARQP